MITLLIVIIFTNLITAQNIVDTTKMWRTAFVTFCSEPYPYNGTESYTRSVRFNEDTLINSLHYKKVFSSLEEYPENWDLLGYIRETQNKEVFFTTDTSNQEYLFFDFNVNINDTISYYWLSDYYVVNDQSIIKSIDTVLIAGEYRKRIGIGGVYESDTSDYWVEGLGNIKHGMLLMSLNYMSSQDIYLTCIYQSDSVIFHNEDENIWYSNEQCYYYGVCDQMPMM